MENVIQTAPQTVIPALYKAAAVSVIALSVAGIGVMTGVLPVKKGDASQSGIGTAQPAFAAPSVPVMAAPVAAPVAPATPVAVQPASGAAQTPVVERLPAPRPRVIRTTSRSVDDTYGREPLGRDPYGREPYGRASPVSNHPVEVSASRSDGGAYGQSNNGSSNGQSPYGQQPYGQQPYGQGNSPAYPPSSQPYPATYPVAQAGTPAKATCYSCGTIESIREVEKAGDGSGLGMAGGALGGAVLGKQFGNGRGRDALTILGAIGGGFAGHQAEKSYRTVKSYEVMVRMEDGSLRSIPSTTQPNWRAGDRVKVEGGSISLNYS